MRASFTLLSVAHQLLVQCSEKVSCASGLCGCDGGVCVELERGEGVCAEEGLCVELWSCEEFVCEEFAWVVLVREKGGNQPI